jgi:capsid assembly protease
MPQFMLLDEHAPARMSRALKDYHGSDKPHGLLWKSPNYQAVADAVAADVQASGGKRKSVAVLPLTGLLEHTQSFYGYMMGGTDLRQWGAAFDSLVANDSVKAIAIVIDSPGGTVFGTPETAAKVYKARGTKPIVAICDPQMCSAAYYIGSAADKVFVTDSAEIGSIGTVMTHEDHSAALEQEGVKVEIIKSGENKWEGHPYGPLSEETRQRFKAQLDAINGEFRAAVAKHRGATVNAVTKTFGEGSVFLASEAVDRGMADKVMKLDDVLRRLVSGSLGLSGGSQEDVAESATMVTPKGPTLDYAERKMALKNQGR